MNVSISLHIKTNTFMRHIWLRGIFHHLILSVRSDPVRDLFPVYDQIISCFCGWLIIIINNFVKKEKLNIAYIAFCTLWQCHNKRSVDQFSSNALKPC